VAGTASTAIPTAQGLVHDHAVAAAGRESHRLRDVHQVDHDPRGLRCPPRPVLLCPRDRPPGAARELQGGEPDAFRAEAPVSTYRQARLVVSRSHDWHPSPGPGSGSGASTSAPHSPPLGSGARQTQLRWLGQSPADHGVSHCSRSPVSAARRLAPRRTDRQSRPQPGQARRARRRRHPREAGGPVERSTAPPCGGARDTSGGRTSITVRSWPSAGRLLCLLLPASPLHQLRQPQGGARMLLPVVRMPRMPAPAVLIRPVPDPQPNQQGCPPRARGQFPYERSEQLVGVRRTVVVCHGRYPSRM
jgi:hypothetical protein